MDINSILSPYGISTNYDVAKTSLTPQKGFRKTVERDSYSEGRRELMSSDMYNYGTKMMNFSKIKNEVSFLENSATEETTSGGSGSGSDSSGGEAKTEVETKVINGQVYMIITTTDEEGNVTIDQMKVGGDTEKGEIKAEEGENLTDMITM